MDYEPSDIDKRIQFLRESDDEDDYDIKPSDIVKNDFLWYEPCWIEDYLITPLYEKIPSRSEILSMNIEEIFRVISSISRHSERLEATRNWEDFKRKTIKGDDLPTTYNEHGQAIEKKPTREGIVRRLKNALDLDW